MKVTVRYSVVYETTIVIEDHASRQTILDHACNVEPPKIDGHQPVPETCCLISIRDEDGKKIYR